MPGARARKGTFNEVARLAVINFLARARRKTSCCANRRLVEASGDVRVIDESSAEIISKPHGQERTFAKFVSKVRALGSDNAVLSREKLGFCGRYRGDC
jgi:hypothetical protein